MANIAHEGRTTAAAATAGAASGGQGAGAEADANELLQPHPETRDRFDRVARLVNGFEGPFGPELLSAVHWAVSHESPQDRAEVESKT